MSSILEALRKVEAREQRRPIRLPPPPPRPRARLAALVAAGAFVAGGSAVALIIAFRPSAPPEPVASAETKVASVTPPAEPAAVSPPAPAVPAPPSTPGASDASPPPPSAAATATPLAAREATPPPADVPTDDASEAPGDEAEVDSDVPEQITILRPAPEAAPEAEVQVEALPTPAPAEPPVDVLPGPPLGAPEIHVSFLIYSAVPERRVVSMTINNGPLVTLHEGQRSGDIALVRILRDRIHVDHNGRIYSVRAVL